MAVGAFLTLHLGLLGGLRHGIDDAEIMLGVLEERFCRHTVAGTGGVAAKLQIFFEKLLRRASDPTFRTIAVKYMITVERYLSIQIARSTS